MDATSCERANWEVLLAIFRRKNFFSERLVLVQNGPRQFALRGSHLRRSARIAVYVAFATLFTFVLFAPPPPGGMGIQHRLVKIVGPFVGLAFLGGATYASLRRDRILFDGGRHVAEFRWGMAPWARSLEVPLGQLRAILYVRRRDEAGFTALGVRLDDGGEQIRLATAKWRDELLPVFEGLKEVLGDLAVDITLAPLSTANEWVCRTPIRATVSRGRNRTLAVHGDEAIIRKPATDSVVLMLMGLVIAISAAVLDWLFGLVPVWVHATIGVLVLFLWGIAMVVRPRTIVIRKDNLLKLPRIAYEGDLPEVLHGRDIAAVQLCTVRGEGEHIPIPLVPSGMIPLPNYTVYQVNLVIKRPGGCRINLFSDTDIFDAQADAFALAELLGVPLLNHG